jgi:hypothetical protein
MKFTDTPVTPVRQIQHELAGSLHTLTSDTEPPTGADRETCREAVNEMIVFRTC